MFGSGWAPHDAQKSINMWSYFQMKVLVSKCKRATISYFQNAIRLLSVSIDTPYSTLIRKLINLFLDRAGANLWTDWVLVRDPPWRTPTFPFYLYLFQRKFVELQGQERDYLVWTCNVSIIALFEWRIENACICVHSDNSKINVCTNLL